MKPKQARLVKSPRFKFPKLKVKFNGKYYRKQLKRIKQGGGLLV
jgi:hypothetical protein